MGLTRRYLSALLGLTTPRHSSRPPFFAVSTPLSIGTFSTSKPFWLHTKPTRREASSFILQTWVPSGRVFQLRVAVPRSTLGFISAERSPTQLTDVKLSPLMLSTALLPWRVFSTVFPECQNGLFSYGHIAFNAVVGTHSS